LKQSRTLRSFDSLRDADLQKVHEQAKQEALREYAFRMQLDSADSLEKLKELVFDDSARPERWTARELLEISNRFRLFDAPEYEIRLYEETRNAEFRAVPRAREFYLLALNKVGRFEETVEECGRLIAEGGGNGLVWGILGDSYSGRMLIAEKFADALEVAGGDLTRVDEHAKAEFIRNFPDLDIRKVALVQVRSLRGRLLAAANQAYRHGFERCGTAFPGLCWMIRTLDQYADLLAERAYLHDRRQSPTPDARPEASLRQTEARIGTLQRNLAAQPILLHVALELEGGDESLDFWPHAGKLQLAFTQGQSPAVIEPILARAFAALDAEFKLEILFDDLSRIRNQHAGILDIVRSQGGKPTNLNKHWTECNRYLRNSRQGTSGSLPGVKPAVRP
jgi:hypothetical protein